MLNVIKKYCTNGLEKYIKKNILMYELSLITLTYDRDVKKIYIYIYYAVVYCSIVSFTMMHCILLYIYLYSSYCCCGDCIVN